ncbi:unnamed protein product [Lactuca saligna]|uniref:Uncharacterized protein n=1 Tax=Lactuca saligna TaxID=75948 RepID=A0AA35VUM1_LACSI|nr:unnamed protein product [Lactuca saligna]
MLLQAMLYNIKGNLDKVQHELQKAKLMLNETFTTLPLEPALSTVPLDYKNNTIPLKRFYWLLVVPLKGYGSHHITEENLGGKIISCFVLLYAFETARDVGALREPKDKLKK